MGNAPYGTYPFSTQPELPGGHPAPYQYTVDTYGSLVTRQGLDPGPGYSSQSTGTDTGPAGLTSPPLTKE